MGHKPCRVLKLGTEKVFENVWVYNISAIVFQRILFEKNLPGRFLISSMSIVLSIIFLFITNREKYFISLFGTLQFIKSPVDTFYFITA